MNAKTWTRLLAALATAGLIASVAFTLLAVDARGVDDARAQALEEAAVRVPALLSYSYRSIDEDFARAKEQTTGQFGEDYATLLDDSVAEVATSKELSTEATISGVGVVEASDDRVDVLVFLTQRTTAPGESPSVAASRVEVEMRPADGGWKIASLTPR